MYLSKSKKEKYNLQSIPKRERYVVWYELINLEFEICINSYRNNTHTVRKYAGKLLSVRNDWYGICCMFVY